MRHHGFFAAACGLIALALAALPAAQSRDDFAYWDSNGNGDLRMPL